MEWQTGLNTAQTGRSWVFLKEALTMSTDTIIEQIGYITSLAWYWYSSTLSQALQLCFAGIPSRERMDGSLGSFSQPQHGLTLETGVQFPPYVDR